MPRHDCSASALALTAPIFASLAASSVPAWAQPSEQPRPVLGDEPTAATDSDVTKQIQNPVGDLISVPMQDNVNFGYGPSKGTQSVVNLQPVMPFHVSDDWNIITRAILPVVWNPNLTPAPSVPVGTAPTSFTAFLSPRRDINGWLWGAGPSAAVVYSGGPWVAGVLANAIFSFGGTKGLSGNRYSTFLGNPFVAYNFAGGWYLSSSPNVTASLPLPGTKWAVPIGGGGGRVFRIGSLPLDLSVSGYYFAVRPTVGPAWQLSTQLTFVF